MHILDELRERNLIAQVSNEDELRSRLDQGSITFYCGYDPTNSSLTVGNLVPIMLQAHLQHAGHKPIVVLGGGTALIGDPSGKTTIRAVLTEEEIQKNLQAQQIQFRSFLNNETIFVNNADWLKQLNYIEFLRDIGRHFSVNEMVTADTYATRLATSQHLSFIEFNYRIVQAYDFLHLHKKFDCELQVGGVDQWGNCVAGTELIRKTTGQHAWVLLAPLMLTASGQKMGKTEQGAIWLDPNRTSPFEYFQYWINCDDRDVARFLKIFTFLSLEEIEQLSLVTGKNIIKAKARLAWEATQLAHGRIAADQALATSIMLFNLEQYFHWDEIVTDGGYPPRADIPCFKISHHSLENGIPIYKLLTEAGLATSGNQAKTLIKSNGVQINGNLVLDELQRLNITDLRTDKTLLLKVGKKRYCLVVAE